MIRSYSITPLKHQKLQVLAFSWISWGSSWSTWQPTDLHVPKISLTVPESSLAQLLSLMTLAISMTSSRSKLPVCLMFFSCSCTSLYKLHADWSGGSSAAAQCDGLMSFVSSEIWSKGMTELTFFLSLTGSFKAFMTREAAEGITETLAIRFCTVSLHVTRRPFHSLAVSFAISSPIFLGDRPRGPIFGANDDAAPTSPPVALTYTSTTCEGSNLGAIAAFLRRQNAVRSRERNQEPPPTTS